MDDITGLSKPGTDTRIQHTDSFLQSKSVHASYAGQKAKDDFEDIMSELEAMRKKNVNSLFNIGAVLATSVALTQTTGTTTPAKTIPDFFEGLQIGPQGELILKNAESPTSPDKKHTGMKPQNLSKMGSSPTTIPSSPKLISSPSSKKDDAELSASQIKVQVVK